MRPLPHAARTALATLATFTACGAVSPPAQAEPSHVIIVRHAERAAEPKDDPGLTAAGQARAEGLADLLAAAPVSTIVTTHYRRTQDTAAPLAQRRGITPIAIRARLIDGFRHIENVVEAVRKAEGVVLVVGHSNTVPALVAALSSSQPTALCETSYGHLFVITPGSPGAPALQLRYGTPDPKPTGNCQ